MTKAEEKTTALIGGVFGHIKGITKETIEALASEIHQKAYTSRIHPIPTSNPLEARPVSIRELRDFLNEIEESYLDNTFFVGKENETQLVHYMERVADDMYYDPDNVEEGNLPLSEWKDHWSEVDLNNLKPGILKGTPVFFEEF